MVDENYLRVFDALGKQFLPFRLIRGWLMSCVFYDAVPAVPFTIGLNCEFSFLWFLVSFVPDLTCSEFFQIIALLSNVWTKKKMAHFWTRCANWVILDVIQGWLFEWLNRRIAIGAKPGSSVTTIMFLFEWLLRGIFAAWQNNESLGFVAVQFGWITMISRVRVAEPVDAKAVYLVFLVVAMVGLKA